MGSGWFNRNRNYVFSVLLLVVALAVTSGKTYYILISAWSVNASGDVTLTVDSVPPNDISSTPTDVTAGFSETINTLNATFSGYIPSCNNFIAKDVWYRITPTNSGLYIFDTTGSNFNTILQVYEFTGSSLAEVANACDPIHPATGQARVEVALTASTTYYILVGGNSQDVEPSGDLVFSVEAGSPV